MPRSVVQPALTLHGVLMQVHGLGVLLTGASGVGKSELALELLSRGHCLIADDAAELRLKRGRIHGSCPPLLRGFLEARSLGILNIRRLYGARSVKQSTTVDLIIALDAPLAQGDSGLERLSGRRGTRQVMGVDIDEISIPIRLGHNLAVLVEAACRDLQLRRSDYRADDDLTRRQSLAIKRQRQPAPSNRKK